MSTLDNPRPEAEDRQPLEPVGEVTAPRGEAFIPLRKADLAQTLAAKLSSPEAAKFGRFCRLLHVLVSCRLQGTLEHLKEAYAPFDPDADTRQGERPVPSQLDLLREELFERFGELLAQGNFVRLAEEEINAALNDRSHWGLHLKVNFELFDRLELYYRGDTTGKRYLRRWRNRLRVEEVEVPIYQRLVVIFRLRPGRQFSKYLDTRDVYIKLFKEIPKLDLDMLLPGTQVQMSLFDRAKVMLPTLSGIAIAVYKVLGMAALTLSTSLAFLGVVGGTLGYGVRSLYGYLNTKQKYQLNLTQSLYYQNIDNNSGVIHRLVDEATEQENREAMLAYYFLWREAPPEGLTAADLDRRIEAWLLAEAEQTIDFEIADALEKLEHLKLAARQGDRWTALTIDEAIGALARAWSELPAAW